MSDRRQATVELESRYGRRGVEVLRRLKETKQASGRLQPADVDRVAAEVGLPRAHVNGAASFFADLGFEPESARHVRVCTGAGCLAASGGAHVEAAEAAAAARGATAQRVHCLGCCFAAPAALDGDALRAGPDLADQLRGVAPARDLEIPFRSAVEEPILLARLLGGGAEPWSVYRSARDAEAVLREVEASGLRGRGGAAFPVARKWATVRASGGVPRYVVANGDEGDPGSYADRLLMERDPHGVLEGVALAARAVGAERAWVYVRSEYPRARESLRAAAEDARGEGLIGGTGLDIEIFEGAGSYVAGEETALIHSMEGLRGAAAARPPYPAAEGLYGRPTVINNVETLSAVPWIVANGGARYAARGTGGSTGTKLVCLNERFAHPGVYEVELGTSVRDICEQLGGGLRDGHELRCLQVGGPLGGFLGSGELDVPLSVEGLRAVGVELGHGGLVAFDERVSGRELLRQTWLFAAEESCGTCAPCRIGSRRGLQLAERICARGGRAETQAMKPILDVMETASLCGLGQGVPAPVRHLLRIYADELEAGP